MQPNSVNKKNTALKKTNNIHFPIVAIGASAGGLEAVTSLLQSLFSKTGMAYFYVQHLSPDHPSNLAQILAKSTEMQVHEARNNQKIEPDNVYVCVPNKEMVVKSGKILLKPRKAEQLPYLPIDNFFIKLAKTYHENVIGIILSGNATDGTEGLKAISEAGGLTFAQDDTAKYKSMPRSAVEANSVDYVLPPKEIARELAELNKKGFFIGYPLGNGKTAEFADNDHHLEIIFEILHKVTGVDFSHYKMTTVKRRLNYRMMHCGVETLEDYVKLLRKDKAETILLHKDLLINVTSFFRDPAAFKYLKSTLLPKLIKNKQESEALRIWVPACSSGEEAYSIAMLIKELQSDPKAKKITVQIFATDLSVRAIQNARDGRYTENDLENVPKPYVKRYFVKTANNYKIVKELREMCVFAPHNLLHDPPFSRMDFISCCNLLIYFDTTAQKKALTSLSFALNDGGYLMLGKSESIGTSSQFFTQVNNKFKIYIRKKNNGNRKLPELTPSFPKEARPGIKGAHTVKEKPVDSKDLDKAIAEVLLSQFMPACAVINKDMEILKFRGSTSTFLSHYQGNASLNILKMTRPEYSFELRNTIRQALKKNQRVSRKDIEINIGADYKLMSIDVVPLRIEWDGPLLLVVFFLKDEPEKHDEGDIDTGKSSLQKDRKIKKLTEELNYMKLEMNNIIQSQETAYEDLQAANEEIVSTNEEFQTLNEELETSKEEIEATNEELISANQELQMRNDLLTESYKYSEAIIATIHEPMVILDNDLHVKSANETFYKTFKVNIEETEGVSLFDLGNNQWDIPELRELMKKMISGDVAFENLEITHTFQDLGERVMRLNAHRIVQKTHREQMILLAFEDITDRVRQYAKEKDIMQKNIITHKVARQELKKAVKRRTLQLEQKNIELENVNTDLTSFTYISSHDLQEPLRKIKNFVSVLIDNEEKKLSADGKSYLHQTYEVANQMQQLLEDLLTYSRTKNIERKFEKTNLNVLLDDVKAIFKEEISEKKCTIEAGELCEVYVIKAQFNLLLQNLLSNSLKFSKPGRNLKININSKIVQGSELKNEPGLLPELLSSRKDYCHIIYTDNGIGFDPQYKERIFEVFQRLHSQREYKGTGMGLAICQRIIDNHGGFITATGKEGKGARFDIYMPVNKK